MMFLSRWCFRLHFFLVLLFVFFVFPRKRVFVGDIRRGCATVSRAVVQSGGVFHNRNLLGWRSVTVVFLELRPIHLAALLGGRFFGHVLDAILDTVQQTAPRSVQTAASQGVVVPATVVAAAAVWTLQMRRDVGFGKIKIEQQHQAGVVVGRCVGAAVVVVVAAASQDPRRQRLVVSVGRKLYVHLVAGLRLRYSYLGSSSIFGHSPTSYLVAFFDSRLRV